MFETSTFQDQVYSVLRDRIINGEIAGLDPLSLTGTAKELGVSKVPVREALVRLEQDGLLSYKQNKGFRVRRLRLAEIEEAFEMRLKLEPDAMSQAAAVATPTDHLEARAAMRALERAFEGYSCRFARLSSLFHLALVGPGNRGITLNVLERLSLMTERSINLHLNPLEWARGRRVECALLYEAWAAGRRGEVHTRCTDQITGTLIALRRHVENRRMA